MTPLLKEYLKLEEKWCWLKKKIIDLSPVPPCWNLWVAQSIIKSCAIHQSSLVQLWCPGIPTHTFVEEKAGSHTSAEERAGSHTSAEERKGSNTSAEDREGSHTSVEEREGSHSLEERVGSHTSAERSHTSAEKRVGSPWGLAFCAGSSQHWGLGLEQNLAFHCSTSNSVFLLQIFHTTIKFAAIKLNGPRRQFFSPFWPG